MTDQTVPESHRLPWKLQKAGCEREGTKATDTERGRTASWRLACSRAFEGLNGDGFEHLEGLKLTKYASCSG